VAVQLYKLPLMSLVWCL